MVLPAWYYVHFNSGDPVAIGHGQFRPRPTLGLILGKQIGASGLTFLFAKMAHTRLPHGATWLHPCGQACPAGIGFTMLPFIRNLSLADHVLMNQVRAGFLSDSLVSAILGNGLHMIAGAAKDEALERSETLAAA